MIKKIYTLELINGKNVVGEFDEVNAQLDDRIVILDNPVAVYLVQDNPGAQAQPHFDHMTHFTKTKTIKFNVATVVYCQEANEDLAALYKKVTGSSTIITPNKGLII